MRAPRLLILDDESGMRRLLRELGERRGFEVRAVGTLAEFETELQRFQPDSVALDLALRDADGSAALESLAAASSKAVVLLVSGRDGRALEEAHRRGSQLGLCMSKPLAKPFSGRDFENAICTPGSEVDGPSLAELTAALRQESKPHGLVLHFQPKLELRALRIRGVEALVRWQHPRLGLLYPARFLPLAERSGCMPALTLRVLDDALRACRGWLERGLDFGVAVNVDVGTLLQPGWVDEVLARLEAAAVPCERLTLEITESSARGDPAAALETLARLRARGVEISLDDFGTGHASLAELQQLPFTELKIDRSFVAEAASAHDAEIILRAMVRLGRDLGLRVVGEGVEDAASCALLESAGCDQAQGYLWSKPVEAGALERWAREDRAVAVS